MLGGFEAGFEMRAAKTMRDGVGGVAAEEVYMYDRALRWGGFELVFEGEAVQRVYHWTRLSFYPYQLLYYMQKSHAMPTS